MFLQPLKPVMFDGPAFLAIVSFMVRHS